MQQQQHARALEYDDGDSGDDHDDVGDNDYMIMTIRQVL